MHNEFKISNTEDIYKGDFDTMCKLNDLEVHSNEAVTNFYNQFGDILQKGEENELSNEDKGAMELIKSEVNSLQRWTVINDKFEKSIVFTRPSQIDIEKGTYKDTALNKKLNRVGKEIKKPSKEE